LTDTLIADALILSAGLGTRLRPLSEQRAKPAMPVGGEVLIRRIIHWLTAHRVTSLVVNLHHRPETLTAVLGDGSDLGARIRYSWEQPRVLGSAGGPRKALPLIDADTFFLVNGDTIAEVDLKALAAAHAASGALVTLALVPNRDYEHYGGVRVDEGNRVTGFSRRGPESKDTWHFVGVQAVNRSVFASLPDDRPASTVGGVYDELIRSRPGAVQSFRSDAAFRDIGTPADYLDTSVALSPDGVSIGARAAIDPSANVSESVLWDDVEVGAGSKLRRCIAADGVRIPGGVEYTSKILMLRDGVLTVTPLEPTHG
jgi:NDP-sugar pyrophosphorylase family protein